jgi:hypothetical protein
MEGRTGRTRSEGGVLAPTAMWGPVRWSVGVQPQQSMQDNANSGEGAQQPRLIRASFDPDDLLISDNAAWETWPVTASAKTCGHKRSLGINTKNGGLKFTPTSCKTYGHQPCAEKIVKGYLRTIWMNLDGRTSGYMTVMDEADFNPKRLKHRLSDFRASRIDDVFDFYRVIYRADRTVTIISTLELTGRLSPRTMDPVDDMVGAAAYALRLPGMRRFHGTRWRIGPGDGESLSHSFGSMFEDEKERFLGEVADLVFERYGVRIDPTHPMSYRSKITIDQYTACGDEVRSRVDGDEQPDETSKEPDDTSV